MLWFEFSEQNVYKIFQKFGIRDSPKCSIGMVH